MKVLWPITVLEEWSARKKLFSRVFSSQVTAPVPADLAKLRLSDDTIVTAYPCGNTEYYRMRNTVILEEKCFCYYFFLKIILYKLVVLWGVVPSNPLSSHKTEKNFKRFPCAKLLRPLNQLIEASFKLFQNHISALIPHACSALHSAWAQKNISLNLEKTLRRALESKDLNLIPRYSAWSTTKTYL